MMLEEEVRMPRTNRGRVCTVGTLAVLAACLLQVSVADAETLTVTKVPAGSGTVVSSPAGINCPPSATTCSGQFRRGTTVTLTATPRAGYYSNNWRGCDSNTAPGERTTCRVTMSRDRAVGISFADDPKLMVNVSPRESAWIQSTPTGIVCGANSNRCEKSFDYGTRVLLSARLYPGWRISGWTGSCASAGTSSSCRLTMTSSAYTTLLARRG